MNRFDEVSLLVVDRCATQTQHELMGRRRCRAIHLQTHQTAKLQQSCADSSGRTMNEYSLAC